MQMFTVKGHSVRVEKTDRRTVGGDCITSRANAVGKHASWSNLVRRCLVLQFQSTRYYVVLSLLRSCLAGERLPRAAAAAAVGAAPFILHPRRRRRRKHVGILVTLQICEKKLSLGLDFLRFIGK